MASLTSADVEAKIKSGHFVIVDNDKGKAPCWKTFGLPARPSSEDLPEKKPTVIDTFAVCKFCLKVLRLSGTKNLNEHLPVCRNKIDLTQKTVSALFPQKDREISAMTKEKIKTAAVEFISCDMQPFSAIEGINLVFLVFN